MRIISGTARGRKLAGFKSNSIRPTSDRVREAVFSSLFSQFGGFQGKKVLDLFAGTGAMTIEALSRGAASAILIDQSRDSESLVHRNLASTQLADKARFKCGPVLSILPQLQGQGPFDLIFLDPPYADNDIEEIVSDLIRFGLLHSDGIICIESSVKLIVPEQIGALFRSARRKYGSTAVSFYRFAEPGDEVQ